MEARVQVKRRDFLVRFGVSSLLAAGTTAVGEAAVPLAVPVAAIPAAGLNSDPMVVRVREAALALQRKDWEHGTLAQAFVELEDWDRVLLMTRAAMILREPDGRLAVAGSGSPTDPAMGGEAYWKAAQRTGNTEIANAVEGMLHWLLKGAPRSADGTLYHLMRRTEMWSDGFNGAPPFLAVMGCFDEAIQQVRGYKARLWDEKKMLLAHQAVEEADGKTSFRQPVQYWGGGMGWAAAGLVRILRVTPPEKKLEKNELIAFLRDVVDGALKYMRPDGLFHNNLDQPESFVETNLSQMLAFSIYTAVDEGWLAPTYAMAADRMRGAAHAKVDALGFVQGVCGAPHFDSAGVSTEGQAFFLMMEAAAQKHSRRA